MNTLTTQLGDAKASISVLETENELLKSDIDINEKTIGDLQEKLAATDTLAKQQGDKITQLETSIGFIEVELTNTDSKIDEVDEHHKELSLGFTYNFELEL